MSVKFPRLDWAGEKGNRSKVDANHNYMHCLPRSVVGIMLAADEDGPKINIIIHQL